MLVLQYEFEPRVSILRKYVQIGFPFVQQKKVFLTFQQHKPNSCRSQLQLQGLRIKTNDVVLLLSLCYFLIINLKLDWNYRSLSSGSSESLLLWGTLTIYHEILQTFYIRKHTHYTLNENENTRNIKGVLSLVID